MAIGRFGVNKAIMSGARLTLFLVVPLTIIKFILDDQQTMFHLVGNLTTDLVKIGVGTALASAAAAGAAAITTLAFGPIIAAIAVGVAATLALDYLDKKFGVTEYLIASLEKGYEDTFGAFGRAVNRLENILRWQALNGVQVGKGIFY